MHSTCLWAHSLVSGSGVSEAGHEVGARLARALVAKLDELSLIPKTHRGRRKEVPFVKSSPGCHSAMVTPHHGTHCTRDSKAHK